MAKQQLAAQRLQPAQQRPAQQRLPDQKRGPAPLRGHWALSLAAWAALACSAMTLGPLLRDTGWWWAMVLTAAVVMAVMATLRQLRAHRILVFVSGCGALLLVLTAGFAPGAAFLGLVPSFETFAQMDELASEGWNSIVVQAIPANATDGLRFLLATGAGLLAIALDVCVLIGRMPAFAAVPLLAVVTIPGLLLNDGAELPILVVVGIAYLVLLRVDARMRRTGPARDRGPVWGAAIVGTGALVAALVLTGINPALSDVDPLSNRPSGTLFGSGINAMTTLGNDLRRPSAVPALRYSSSTEGPLYLGMLVLDFFNGKDWIPSGLPVDVGNTVNEVSVPQGLSASVPSDEIETRVKIAGVRSNWLPVPAATTRITGLEGDWFWEANTRAVASFSALTSGQDYTVSSLRVQPTVEQLQASSGVVPEELLSQLELPRDRPAIIDETTASVTRGLTNPWEIAVALQAYFRSGEFRYSEDAPVEEDYDGDGLDITARFLEVKAGYCVHFASSMTMMARISGIPARIAIGYQPGTRTSESMGGSTAFDVSSDDLHAWPELYFDGIGWVAFEPTPTRGSVPAYSLAPRQSGTTPSVAPAAPAATPGAAAPGGLRPDTDPGAAAAVRDTAAANAQTARVVGLSLGGLLLLCVPLIVRQTRRRARFNAILRGSGIEPAWRELSDTAIDLDLAVRRTETPRVLAARLREEIVGDPGADEALRGLLATLERYRFAPHDTEHAKARDAASARLIAQQLRLVQHALGAHRHPLARLRAVFAPRSLWSLVRARAGWRASDA